VHLGKDEEIRDAIYVQGGPFYIQGKNVYKLGKESVNNDGQQYQQIKIQ
jgi:hypothetical protein